MKSTTTASTTVCLQELFSRFGLPEVLVTDNGPQFISDEFRHFVKSIGARHIRTAPYHPSSHGLAERFVQTFKVALRKSSEPALTALHSFLLLYRNTPHATTRETPAYLLLGRNLRMKLDSLRPSLEAKVSEVQFKQAV